MPAVSRIRWGYRNYELAVWVDISRTRAPGAKNNGPKGCLGLPLHGNDSLSTKTHCRQWRGTWWISLCCTIAWLIGRDHCMSLWHNMKRPLSILGYSPRLFFSGLRKFIDKFGSDSIVLGYQPHHFGREAPDDGNRKRLRNVVLLFRIVASFYNHSCDRQQLIFQTGNFWTYFCDVWKPEMGLKLSPSELWRRIVWYMGTKLNGIKSQKTIIMISTAVRASSLTFYCSR
jgi:hypothetical protein